MLILRVIVLLLTIPFGLLAAIIPSYTAGQVVAMTGLPAAIGEYLIGGVVMVYFCGYFQYHITPS